MRPVQSTAILPCTGASQAFYYGLPFHVGIRLMEPPGAPIHSNNKLKVIPFVLPRFLLIMRPFVTHPTVCYTLCISFKTSFQCPRLWLCYVHVFFTVIYIILFLVLTQQKLFLVINYIKFNLIYVINKKLV